MHLGAVASNPGPGGGSGAPAWVPEGALAWSDFANDVHSADGGAITTLAAMWEGGSVGDFDTSDVTPDVGIVGTALASPTPYLTASAVTEFLSGLTVVLWGQCNAVGAGILASLHDDPEYVWDFYVNLRQSGAGEFGDQYDHTDVIEGIPDATDFKTAFTISPSTVAVSVGGAAVVFVTPEVGAEFTDFYFSVRDSSIIQKVALLAPVANASLVTLSAGM
jgi:hypothetical protein